MKIELQRIATGFQGEFCYTHARGAAAPDGRAVITTQPLRLTGSDIFYAGTGRRSGKCRNWRAAPFPATRNGRSRWRTPRRFTMPPPENSC